MTTRRPSWDIRNASRDLMWVSVGLLVINTLFFVLLARPRVLEYRSLDSENAPRLRAVEAREARVETREGYLQALQQAQDDLERLRAEVLSTRDRRMIVVQEEVADLADQFNINMEEITYDNEILEDEGIERFAMTVPLEGGYANLRRFLNAVEDSEEFLVIEQVALAEGDEGGVVLNLAITMATYFDLPSRPGLRRGPGRRA